ncbi:MAG: rRNA maturation RNase YbeY [Lachnospiraceae bacterium]|nr:rRNA maturation RNase YbeY [Ruminococcus sp.]MCM1276071.1 rRNA maturation RNase YbeY [Lachnospiraceae bacterium]
MKIYIDYLNEQDKLDPPEDFEQLIEDCARAALEEEGIEDDAEVSVTLVDNARIRGLNAEHRGIDRETDVLSFPLGDENGFEVNPDTDAILLGDVVISLEKALSQAEEYGHGFRRETAFLLTHSLFHLLGYDHTTADEEKEMFAKQEKVLHKLGITR